MGCPYAGFAGKGQGATATCPGWYRKQDLFYEMSQASHLRDFWTNMTPDDLTNPLVEFFFWNNVYKVRDTNRRMQQE